MFSTFGDRGTDVMILFGVLGRTVQESEESGDG